METENKLIAQRAQKARALRDAGIHPYANDFRVGSTCVEFAAAAERTSVAGRIMAIRDFKKLVFMVLQDRTGRLQVMLQKDNLSADDWARVEDADVGDFVGASGTQTVTKTGELSLLADELRHISKGLRPLPDRHHGLVDREKRYRQRYVDLMVNEEVADTFRKRSKIVRFIRNFFDARGFLEVETPMMQPIAGGAAARPFKTHHNALDMDLFLRIAPELYLKRLVVGGLERVYEINRSFRNEGLSPQHNPEFTLLEFYAAYWTYHDIMELTEELIGAIALDLHDTDSVTFQDTPLQFARPWKRATMFELLREAGIPNEAFTSAAAAYDAAVSTGCNASDLDRKVSKPWEEQLKIGDLLFSIFEHVVEETLVQPTFVTEFPVAVSPLARRNENNPSVTDRFELFIHGREIANAFSELTDPADQRQRFEWQDADNVDDDFIRALEYGMPPTAGCGIGIDRLVMLLTDQPSIRDVILFPLLRQEA